MRGTETLYKYVDYLFLEFDDAEAAQSFIRAHETFGARNMYEAVLRYSAIVTCWVTTRDPRGI